MDQRNQSTIDNPKNLENMPVDEAIGWLTDSRRYDNLVDPYYQDTPEYAEHRKQYWDLKKELDNTGWTDENDAEVQVGYL